MFIHTVPSERGNADGDFFDLDPILVNVYSAISRVFGDERSAVFPGDVTSFSFGPGHPPTLVECRFDTGLYLASTMLWIIKWVMDRLALGLAFRAILDTIDALMCVVGVINSTYDITDDGDYHNAVTAMLGCIRTAFDGETGAQLGRFLRISALGVLGVMIGVAGVIATAIVAILRRVMEGFLYVCDLCEIHNANTIAGHIHRSWGVCTHASRQFGENRSYARPGSEHGSTDYCEMAIQDGLPHGVIACGSKRNGVCWYLCA